MKNIQRSVYIFSVILNSLLFGCKEQESEIINLHLDSVYIDTTYKTGMFRDIKIISKNYDLATKRVNKISGVVEIKEMIKSSTQNNTIDVELYIKGDKKVIRIDTDRDGSLLDEKEYNVNEKSEFITIPDVEVSIGKATDKLTLFALPQQGGLFTPKDKYDLSFTGILFLWVRKAGLLSIGNTYNIAVTNVSEGKFNNKETFIYISEQGVSRKKEILYRIGDIVHLDRNLLRLKEIDSTGSVLILEKLGIEEKQYGFLEGDYALPIIGKDVLNGKELVLIDEPGKLTLLDFWGTWCLPCIKLTDELKQLEKQYSKNLKLIGIAVDPSEQNVKNYIEEKKVGYKNIYEKMDGPICSKYLVRDFPTYILIDSDGKIIFRGSGLEYFSDLKQLLRKKIAN